MALQGPANEPVLVWREEISLIDPSVPETGQPYHAVMDLPWARATESVKPYVRAIEAVAVKCVAQFKRDLEARGLSVRQVTTVGSHDRLLEKIGNPHMRAHAAEGMLFRRVLELAAEQAGLRVETVSDRLIKEVAATSLQLSDARIQSVLKRLGAEAGPPWRSDEKAAAIGAWIALRNNQPRRA